MIDAHDLARRYIASWNETDPAARQRLIAALWTEDARYIDPMAQAAGQDAIAALIGGVHHQFPGHRFNLTGQPDGHGSFVRFSWSLGQGHGQPVACGTDFAAVSEDGRLSRITGFLDPVPATA